MVNPRVQTKKKVVILPNDLIYIQPLIHTTCVKTMSILRSHNFSDIVIKSKRELPFGCFYYKACIVIVFYIYILSIRYIFFCKNLAYKYCSIQKL